jgi:hypothetical protein
MEIESLDGFAYAIRASIEKLVAEKKDLLAKSTSKSLSELNIIQGEIKGLNYAVILTNDLIRELKLKGFNDV